MTVFVGIMAVASGWTEIQDRIGFFYFNLLWVLAGISGVFLALDLFLFYFFWEMMLVPMYFIIVIWGHENRVYAAIKFFLFTQISGLLMFVAILGLYFVHGRATGQYTFNYLQLLGTSLSPSTARWLMLGFLAAFAVKLPVVPLHTWLPDAHTEAPTPGSVILAGLLLKTGAYGLLRFVVPLFPAAALDFVAPTAMGLAVVSILYGGPAGLCPDGSQAVGGLHQRQSHGIRAAGGFCLEPVGLAGRRDANRLSRRQHRRPLYAGGFPSRKAADT